MHCNIDWGKHRKMNQGSSVRGALNACAACTLASACGHLSFSHSFIHFTTCCLTSADVLSSLGVHAPAPLARLVAFAVLPSQPTAVRPLAHSRRLRALSLAWLAKWVITYPSSPVAYAKRVYQVTTNQPSRGQLLQLGSRLFPCWHKATHAHNTQGAPSYHSLGIS